MNSLVNVFETKTIYKIKYYYNQNIDSFYTYIFVGPRSEEIKKILEDIEFNNNLGSSMKKKLQAEFGNYDKKFGPYVPGKTFFIYHFINDNIIINHLLEDIYILITQKNDDLAKNIEIEKFGKNELLPHKLYLWTHYKSINQTKPISILNQIFYDYQSIDNETFILRLENVTMLSRKEMLIKLKQNKKIYQSVNDIKFLSKEYYEYQKL